VEECKKLRLTGPHNPWSEPVTFESATLVAEQVFTQGKNEDSEWTRIGLKTKLWKNAKSTAKSSKGQEKTTDAFSKSSA